MTEHFLIYLGIVIAYLLTGTLYALVYLIAYKPEKHTTALGLLVVFWWLYIIVEILLQIIYGIGTVALSINKRLSDSLAERRDHVPEDLPEPSLEESHSPPVRESTLNPATEV